MILGIAHNDDAAPARLHFVALGDSLGGVVRTLGMKIRMDFANNGAHIFFWKDYNRIHIRERRQNFGPFFSRHHGPSFAFQRAHGSVGIYRDNQFAAEFPRRMQVANMADMQQIETTIGQGDTLASPPPIGHALPQVAARNNLRME